MEPIDSHTQCIYLAQYQEYLVFFSLTTTVNEEELVPIQELNETIKNLDKKLGSRFTSE
jgi:predicted nucleic acid-binding protein